MDGPAGLPATGDHAPPLEAVFASEAAFRAWYDGAFPVVYRYLYHRCGRDHALAEELTQQTFVEVVRSRDRFAGDEPVAWLIGIARHRLIDHFRRLERRDRGLRRWLATAPREPVGWIGEPTADDPLVLALAGLPEGQRVAIILRYLDDLAVREVARLMGRSEGAVESLLSRGRDALRRAMEGVER